MVWGAATLLVGLPVIAVIAAMLDEEVTLWDPVYTGLGSAWVVTAVATTLWLIA